LGRELTDVQINQIIEYTNFDNMKKLKSFELNAHFKEEFSFFRKGQSGDWKNYFTEEMSKRYDEKTKKELSSYAKIYCEN